MGAELNMVILFGLTKNISWIDLLDELEGKKDPCDYHTRCHDCGRFVKPDLWDKEGENKKALGGYCYGKHTEGGGW